MSQNNKKQALRKTLLERRDALSFDFVGVCEKQIQKNLLKIPEYRDASSIGCYYAVGSEAPTQQIILYIRSSGRLVCLPRVRNESLEFAAVSEPSDLVKGELGILEPTLECKTCDKPDVILVPTVGVARNGARLGRGRGFYDRYLANYDGVSIGLAFSVQVVNRVPEENHDVPLSWIVTEDETTRI